MKFTLDNVELAEALRIISSGIGKVGPNALPPRLLLEAEGKMATVTSMNQNGCIRVDIPIDLMGGDKASYCASYCFGLEKLIDVIGHLEKPLTFNPSGSGWVFVESGNSRFRLPEFPVDIFPDPGIPKKMEGVIKIGSDVLRQMMHSAGIATARDDHQNFALRDVHVEIKSGEVIIEGCDGTELMRAVAKLDGKPPDENFLIPKHSVTAMTGMIRADKVTRMSVIGNKRLMVKCGPYMIVSRTSAMSFPAVDQLIPDDSTSTARLNIKDLASAMKRVKCFNDNGEVTMDFDGLGTLTMSAASSAQGAIKETLETLNEAKPGIIKISADRLLSCLNELSSEACEISFGGKHRHVMVKPIDADMDLTYVTVELMPDGGWK